MLNDRKLVSLIVVNEKREKREDGNVELTHELLENIANLTFIKAIAVLVQSMEPDLLECTTAIETILWPIRNYHHNKNRR